MNYRIEALPEKKLIGMKLNMSLTENRTAELWKSFIPYRPLITENLNADMISMQIFPPGYFNNFSPATVFEKWAAVEVSLINQVPEGLHSFLIPPGLYVVFEYKGLSTDNSVFQYIFGNWLPGSDYQVDNRPHFEILGERYKNADPDSEEEIWIPVRLKKEAE